LGDRFTLITQNVDGLHLRAGNRIQKTYQIHGNIFQVRCAAACSPELQPLPMDLIGRAKEAPLTDAERALLTCRRCGERLRPHVLWFDEVYDERYFHFDSSLQAAAETGLLLIVGTSGVTNLPNQVAWTVFRTAARSSISTRRKTPFPNWPGAAPAAPSFRCPAAAFCRNCSMSMQQEIDRPIPAVIESLGRLLPGRPLGP
jgi:NAD-dependent SIR2 family protein deacetylase